MKGFRYLLASLLGALVVLAVGSAWLGAAQAEVSSAPANIIANGSFELGAYAPENAPDGWGKETFLPSAQFTWRDDVAEHGQKSVQITAETANDARWIQTVAVKPNSRYLFSGWIKTENVVSTAPNNQAGANLCLNGTFQHTAGITGTNDWTYVSMLVDSGVKTQLTLCARLGYWSDATSGTAWFDNLKFVELKPDGPKPAWKVLVLVYKLTDFTYTDGADNEHRVIASMTTAERQKAAQNAQAFVQTDIPALSSGNSQPEITVRYPPQTISALTPYGSDAWWLAPANIEQDLDPAFDSIIVVWNPVGTDINTNDPEDLSKGKYVTNSPGMGTNQTYTLITAAAATNDVDRNAFKKGYGGSILAFYNQAGTAPKPKVNNNPTSTEYVNCSSGAAYVWEVETLAAPIPNSIYNNDSGFTHDYYSGTTASADALGSCLGLNGLAWVSGGPVSGPVFYDFSLLSDPELQTADPGVVVSYTLHVENSGNVADTYQINYSGSTWPLDGPLTTGPIGVDQSWEAPLLITVPLEAGGLDIDMVTVDLQSEGDAGLSQSVVLTTQANAIYNFAAGAGTTALSGDAGTAVTYTVKIDNSSNISDTYDVAYSGNAWAVDGPAVVGPAARAGAVEFDVVVTIPADAAGLAEDNLTVTITSQGDNSVQAGVDLTTTANARYAFTAGANPDKKKGDVGTGVVYAIKIENNGNIDDTYDVIYSGNSWQVTGFGTVGPLPADDSTTLNVTVNIPSNAKGFASDFVAVTLTSQGDNSQQTAVLLTTEANAFTGVQLSPSDLAGFGTIGTSKTYTLTLKNTGNISDTFGINGSISGWEVAYPVEVGPLEPNQSAQFAIKVTVAPDAGEGDEETTIITAISKADDSTAASTNITTKAIWPHYYFPLLVN